MKDKDIWRIRKMGQVKDLGRSHMNSSLLFEGTIKQTTGTVPLASKTTATTTLENQYVNQELIQKLLQNIIIHYN